MSPPHSFHEQPYQSYYLLTNPDINCITTARQLRNNLSGLRGCQTSPFVKKMDHQFVVTVRAHTHGVLSVSGAAWQQPNGVETPVFSVAQTRESRFREIP